MRTRFSIVDSETVKKASALFSAAESAVALTGAGISAESGIPTFRDPGGLWDRYDPSEYATISAFIRDPAKVWKLFRELASGPPPKPNAGHLALARLEAMGKLHAVITQNIDHLHQEAGSKRVVEFHGNVREVVCLSCGVLTPMAEVSLDALPPRCGCGGILKPNCTFFGEMIPPDALEEATRLARTADLMLVVGTSCEVYPAADLAYLAKERGASVIEVNPAPTPLTGRLADVSIRGKAGEVLPELVAALGTSTTSST